MFTCRNPSTLKHLLLNKNYFILTIGFLLLIAPVNIHAQAGLDGGQNPVTDITINPRLISSLALKYKRLNNRIAGNSARSLQRLEQQENKLRKRLAAIDSNRARQLFGQSTQLYKGLQDKLQTATGKVQKLNQYLPGLDSLTTATKFLQAAGNKLRGFSPEKLSQLQHLGSTVAGVQNQLQSATDTRKLLSERKQQLQQALEQYGFTKELKRLNKEVYYYRQQLNEYKEMLHDEQKAEQKVLAWVKELPAFKEFMSRNSLLSQLFRVPGNYGTARGLNGLQTRAAVQQQLTQRPGGGAYLQQQVQAAQTRLNQLKEKVNRLGSSGSDGEMPGFTPNQQKTKTFLQRLEYGFNIQSQKTSYLLPVTSDLALTIGYKLNDKSIAGIGAAYKLGWGNGFKNIKLTSEGIGLRSYVDIKLKGSFWISGGYEQNYQNGYSKIPQLDDYSKWQQSGLIGLSRKYRIGKKKGNLQLLWDFLSYRQMPKTQPLKFRIGYQL